jgi:PAS domain S-box-containing protein
VLVVDDNADMRQYVTRLLREHYEVETAADGDAALAAARARKPDLILSDVMMPKLDGLELLKELRADERLKTVPVILLSARAGEESRVEGLHRGADDYLIKPFSARELLARVDAHMNMGRIRRQAEEAVRESEGRFREMANHAPVMVWVTEPDRSCTFLSKSWYGFTGQTPETGLRSGWLGAVHPDDREVASRAFIAANEKREILRIEYRLRRADGEYGWAMDSAVPRFGRNGEFLGYIGSVIDITDRKRAEEAKARLAAIVESSDDAIISKGLDGVITSWNSGAERLFGYTPQEVIGRPITILMPPERVDEEPGILQRIRRGERIEHYETVRRRKDGTLLDISLTVSPITDSGGKIVGASKIARDITERKRTEEALCRLKDELEARVAERTRELVLSEHRLRAFATELNLTEQRERRRLASELHDYLAQLLALAKMKLAQARQQPMTASLSATLGGVQDVMNQALTYTRTLVAQLSPPMLQEFGLPSALKWLAEQMKERGLTVELDVKQDIAPLAEDTAVLLFQSVRELLINVTKHGRTQQARVTVTEEDGLIGIVVTDQGIGFHLAAAGTPESPTTLGFGLFSIRERMAALDGNFSITSAPGQGTTATLVLPRTPQAAIAELGILNGELSKAPTSSHSAFNIQNSAFHRNAIIRVLLVDDHAMVRQGLRGLLEAYDDIAIVGEAATGEEAVALVGEVEPDVILMDVNLPGMDGMQSTRRITQASQPVCVIGLSIQDAEEVETAMKEAGAVAFLNKEAALDELYQTIKTAWKRNEK